MTHFELRSDVVRARCGRRQLQWQLHYCVPGTPSRVSSTPYVVCELTPDRPSFPGSFPTETASLHLIHRSITYQPSSIAEVRKTHGKAWCRISNSMRVSQKLQAHSPQRFG